MNLHNLQTQLGLALAGLALVISVGFFVHKPAPQVTEPDIPASPVYYTEVMPESTGESYRIHVRNTMGVETAVQIKFLDGSDGVLQLYPDGDTKEEVRLFLDKSVRKQASFDTRGQLTQGFEYREDRTLLWKAAPLSGGRTVTQSYWPSGPLFLQRVYDPEKQTTSLSFYRENGTRWQESLSVGQDVLLEQRLYDESSRLRTLYSLVYDGVGSPKIQVLYLNEKGQPDFDQHYGHTADYYYDPASGVPNPNRLALKSVGVYDEAKLVGRVFVTSSGRLHLIERYRSNSTERSYIQSDGTISQIEVVEPGGSRSAQYDFDGKFGKAPPLDDRLRVPLPDRTVPFKHFDAVEKLHRKAVTPK